MSPIYACLHAVHHTCRVGEPAGTPTDEVTAERLAAGSIGTALLAAVREFSPRVESVGPGVVLCDLTGVTRLFGDARTIAAELRREAAERGVPVRVAVAATRTAALLLAHARPGVTVIECGDEAAALQGLPVSTLDALVAVEAQRLEATPLAMGRFYRTSPMEDLARHRARSARSARSERPAHSARSAQSARSAWIRVSATLERWGIRTLGDLARLPASDLAARLGPDGPAWQRAARGEDAGPLVPAQPDERFEGHLDLEWPIEGLEPLSFVLGRLLEPIAAHLERRDRAAAALVVELRLVSRETVSRRLQLPAPMRDPRVLRTLALLDLDAHPPSAGIDAVTVRIEPTPGRITQHSLLERARPAHEQVTTLMARLTALMGENRCGAPAVPDTHRPGAFTMQAFTAEVRDDVSRVPGAGSPAPGPQPAAPGPRPAGTSAPVVLRRFRQPVPVRVGLDAGRPVRMTTDRPGVASGAIETCAGPWHSSGDWWKGRLPAGAPHARGAASGWNRDEWDVALRDGTVCRIFQDRDTHGWFIEGVMD